MTKYVLLLASIIFFSPLISWAKNGPKPIDSIAAIVNDDIITSNELEQELEKTRKQIRAQNTLPPPGDILKKQVLEREITKHVLLQLAKNTGIYIDDNALNNTIDSIAAQNKMDIRSFRDVLKQDGYDFEQFREDIREEMIIARLQQRDINNTINVTEQEVDSFIATQQVQGQSEMEFNISHILISVPEAANASVIDKTRLKAEEVLAKIKAGGDFAQTAISHSDGQLALKGGEFGWRKSGQLPTLFARQMPHMKKGEVSDLLRSPSGFHIIKLNDKRRGEKHIITQTLARHILIKPTAVTSEMEAIGQLRQLKQRIENGDKFEDLARSHSEDPGSGSQGGNLNWTSPGDLVPQFQAVMDSLKLGEISEPFQTPFGWHIVQVQKRRDLDNSEEYSRNQAKDFIRQRKTDEARESWIRQLRNEAFVEFKNDN